MFRLGSEVAPTRICPNSLQEFADIALARFSSGDAAIPSMEDVEEAARCPADCPGARLVARRLPLGAGKLLFAINPNFGEAVCGRVSDVIASQAAETA